MTPLSAFLTFVLPAAVVALGLLASSFLARRSSGPPEEPRPAPGLLGRLLPPALFTVAFWPADIALNQWHDLWPTDGTRRFLAVAIAAGVAGLAHAAAARPLPAGIVRAILGALIPLGLLSPLPEQYMPRSLLVILALVTPCWLAATGAALDAAERRLPKFGVPGALALAAIACAPGLFEIGYAGGAQLAGALGAIGGGAAVAMLLRRRLAASLAGAHTVWLALLAAVLLVTYGYQDVHAWWALPLFALAPLGALAGVPLKRPRLRAAAAICTPAIIAAAATLAVVASAPDDTGDSYSID